MLVVDDNATNRRILGEMLTSWRLRPHAGGRRAPRRSPRSRRATGVTRPFHLVLLDAQMPEMDGFKLAERIQKRSRAVCAPMMILLTSAGGQDAARVPRARASLPR